MINKLAKVLTTAYMDGKLTLPEACAALLAVDTMRRELPTRADLQAEFGTLFTSVLLKSE